MAHWSEDSFRLETNAIPVTELEQLSEMDCSSLPAVYFFCLPGGRDDSDAARSAGAFRFIADFCSRLNGESTVCVLTTPPDAAILLPHLQQIMKFQLWVAVKLASNACTSHKGALPKRHAALLILSRYHGSLRHTKTRIRYTYCPACGKTTKDYGGKKHLYHEYGTLISDVWRDIECDPQEDIDAVSHRLADLFGLKPYRTLYLLDLRKCLELAPLAQINPEKPLQPKPQADEIKLESGLINGDCLETLRTFPDNSIDFCFADPPYNLKKRYDRFNDSREIIDYFSWCDLWLAEMARVLKPGGTLAVVNIPLWTVRYYKILSTILNFQNWIVWDALSFPVRMIMPAHYAILCFSKGAPRSLPGLSCNEGWENDLNPLAPLAESFCLRSSCVRQRNKEGICDREEIGDLWHDIHRLKHNDRRVDHPCQLPPRLMQRLFALFTYPGEIILDCFNGAGTSTLVAQQMGRRFVGIEISPEYHEIALKRHEMLKQGEDPFGKCASVPKAKNSPVERLPKQKYRVTKKALQLEIKRIADQTGHIPTREDVMASGRYPLDYYDRYFLSWGEVCAAARTTGMSELPPERKNKTYH